MNHTLDDAADIITDLHLCRKPVSLLYSLSHFWHKLSRVLTNRRSSWLSATVRCSAIRKLTVFWQVCGCFSLSSAVGFGALARLSFGLLLQFSSTGNPKTCLATHLIKGLLIGSWYYPVNFLSCKRLHLRNKMCIFLHSDSFAAIQLTVV